MITQHSTNHTRSIYNTPHHTPHTDHILTPNNTGLGPREILTGLIMTSPIISIPLLNWMTVPHYSIEFLIEIIILNHSDSFYFILFELIFYFFTFKSLYCLYCHAACYRTHQTFRMIWFKIFKKLHELQTLDLEFRALPFCYRRDR